MAMLAYIILLFMLSNHICLNDVIKSNLHTLYGGESRLFALAAHRLDKELGIVATIYLVW